LVGTRFKSREWHDYDLCEQCHSRPDRAEALGVPPDHNFKAIPSPHGRKCGGVNFFDRILERMEEDPVAFCESVAPMFDLQQMIPKLAHAAIQVVVDMNRDELLGLLDPLTAIVEQDEFDVQTFPQKARVITQIIHAAPAELQSELKQRFWAEAMKLWAGERGWKGWKGWGKGWKGWKGCKGWKGAGKGLWKGAGKGAFDQCSAAPAHAAPEHEDQSAPEAKRQCTGKVGSGTDVHQLAISTLMSHPDPKIRDAVQAAMESAKSAPAAEDPQLEPYHTQDSHGVPMPKDSAAADIVTTHKLSAALVGDPAIELSSGAIRAEPHAGNVSDAWAPVLSQFASLTSAHLLGRLVRETADDCTVTVRLAITNDGDSVWPADTHLRIAAGDALGSECVPVGDLPVGEVFYTTLMLNVSRGVGASRSAWALESRGEPFGPMLILEYQS
jgi:hypothetical protein